LQSSQVDMGDLAIENISKEVQSALGQTLTIENHENGQTLEFKKILYKGLLTPNPQPSVTFLLNDEPFPKTLLDLDQSKLALYFPLFVSGNQLYPVQLSNKDKMGIVEIKEKNLPITLVHPVPFFIVSESIRYHYSKPFHLLERTQGEINENNKALLANRVQDCHFAIFNDKGQRGVTVTLMIGNDQKSALSMSHPIYINAID
jgi:hypothetical protein